MAGPTVRVLGELSVDGVDVRADLDRRARVLLRLLALARGRAVTADALVDALWGDRPPARPADQVSVLVSRVRRALGREAVQLGDGGYRLAGVPVDIDELDTVVAEAERRLAEGRAAGAVAASRVALALVRGPVADAETEAEWAVHDQQAAVRLVRRARAAATTALVDSGAWPEALDLASADLAADPYDEAAARAVMRAQVAAGRPALALQTFATLRATLADELGSDPDPETTALHEQVLRGESGATARPGVAPTLVGRTSQFDHLDTLIARVADGRPRLAVVHGEAGIGKTTLLRSWIAARTEVGDVVLTGACGELDRSAPLDVVLAAIDDHLRRSDDPDALLGEETAWLGPLLGRSAPDDDAAMLDPILGPATLYAAVTRVLDRIAGERPAVLVIDDAHLAGPALADWLQFVQRRPLRLLVVAAVRSGEGVRLPATDEIGLGPLGLAEVVQLVGAERAEDLHARSGGHPLFLSELAGAAPDQLPDTLVAAVVDRCDQLGDAADLIRTAAVLGPDLDVDLLGVLLGLPALEVLRRMETAAERELIVENEGRYSFRHDLVRTALSAGTPSTRAGILHREAAHVLAARTGADPLQIATHARAGGYDELAARALHQAAERASARFDHASAALLLAESAELVPSPETSLARARVRIRLGEYGAAEDEALAAGSAEGSEIAAWAAYFDRRFADAAGHAEEAERGATDAPARARALMARGRTQHAAGDLTAAEQALTEATTLTSGADRLTASAWLGVLLAHRSRPAEALALLRPATRPGVGVDHTSAALHALLFTGHAHALAGDPVAALAAFDRYTEEVERRQVPRFAGRGVNFGGWVLRSLGATGAGTEAHHAAREVGDSVGTAELEVAVLEDLAEERILAGDPDTAAGYLDKATGALTGDLVFGWRLALKLRLHQARLALLRGDAETALAGARDLAAAADALDVPRYGSVARLVAHHARAALGEPVDLDSVAADLAAVERAVRIEAWWWAGETAAALGSRPLLDRAASLAADLAAGSGEYGDALRAEADRRLGRWSVSVR